MSAITAINPAAHSFTDLIRATPGSYIKSCRTRAGLTHRAVAERIAVHEGDRRRAVHDLDCLERDLPGDYGILLQHLKARRVFDFDLAYFSDLASATCAAETDWPDAA